MRRQGADVERREGRKRKKNTATLVRRGTGVWAASVTVQTKDPIKAFGGLVGLR